MAVFCSGTMKTFVILATVATIFHLANALNPNTPNYYNRNERWNNDGEPIHYDTNISDILAHIGQENNAKNTSTQQESRFLKNEQRKSITEKWNKSLAMLSHIVGSLGIQKLNDLALPYDVCYFSEEIKRSLCAEGMRIIEQMAERQRPVGPEVIPQLFGRHNYDCKPKRVNRTLHPINCIFCPVKFIFDNDSNGLGSVLDSYIEGFYFSQSTLNDKRLYLFVSSNNGNNDELLPVAEMNGIKLGKGSSITDIARAFTSRSN